jgi:hypothetical protein
MSLWVPIDRMSDMHRYAVSVGAFRIGIFLACVFLLVHPFVEPRREAYFNPLVDTVLILSGFAIVGYVI